MNKNKGFTLIELIIAIAIMAILVGVIAINLFKYIDRSNMSADIQSADAIASEFQTEYLSNSEIYSAVNAYESYYTPENVDDPGVTYLIATCGVDDDSWNVGNSFQDCDELVKLLETDCSPRRLRYTKEINPLEDIETVDEAAMVAPYALGGLQSFEPNGWAIAVIDGETCVFVTDGENPTCGICISPVKAPEYPGYALN